MRIGTHGKNHLANLFPELGAGGYTSIDGTIEFYTRVRSVVPSSATIVDLGAGRGKLIEDPVEHRRELRQLSRTYKRVVGLDIDDAVMENPTVHEAHVIERGKPFPLLDASVDAVVSDWTLEHVTDPEWLLSEIDRVLVNGGWFCARTPNKWGVVGLPTAITPNKLHNPILARLQPEKRQEDTFPTAYRMNSRGQLKRLCQGRNFEDFSYFYDAEPSYVGRSSVGAAVVLAAGRILPRAMKPTFMVFLRKTV